MAPRVCVTICALTYGRHQGLERLLRSLESLQVVGRGADRRILVVDNNPDGSARGVCESFPSLGDSLVYVHEPRPGIVVARNAALDRAVRDSDWIAFIDDDEVPEPGWIETLEGAALTHRADVLAGPVLPVFEGEVPGWVTRGRFFHSWRHATGKRLSRGFTGNVLFRADVVRRLGVRFDERLNFVGGEDSHFFERLSRAGYPTVWVDEAIVREWIPSHRVTAPWLIRRKYWSGHIDAFIRLDAVPGIMTRLRLWGAGAIWGVLGAGVYLWGLVAGMHWRVRGRRAIAYGRGLIAGSDGSVLEAYTRPGVTSARPESRGAS